MDGSLISEQHQLPRCSDDQIELTLIASPDPLTKTYELGSDGQPKKVADPFLTKGVATRFHLDPANFAGEFSDVLTSLDATSCVVLGTLSDVVEGDEADITTKDRHHPSEPGDGSPLIWRGKEWLGYRAGVPAVLGLDHDAKDLPDDIRHRLEAAGGLLAVLEDVCPALADAAAVIRPSTSTGVAIKDGGPTSIGGGLHVYLPIRDGGDAADFTTRLHERLILAGWGFAFVTKAGSVLIRSTSLASTN